MDGSANHLERNFVDPAYRCAVEGFASEIWGVPNRASPFPELGALQSIGASVIGGGPRSQGPRWTGSERVVHRRKLCSGEKRGLCVGKTKRGKGTKIMAIADRNGLPVAVCTDSASPAEVKLVNRTLEQRFIADVPERLVGDKAYDSDPLDEEVLNQFGTEMIAPHREGRRVDTVTQDGRALRRAKRRWKVERLFAWLYNFRRLVVRYEYHAENYHGFVQLACLIVLLRYL
jgi:transposase